LKPRTTAKNLGLLLTLQCEAPRNAPGPRVLSHLLPVVLVAQQHKLGFELLSKRFKKCVGGSTSKHYICIWRLYKLTLVGNH